MLSQTKHEPFADEKFGKVYYIETISEAPVIDGVLDEAIWSSILPITDFVQEEPDNMAEPTEKTEVYLTYDEKSLYVAARLYDVIPSDITMQLAPRDDWFGAFDEMADWFSIDLDSRHDHQTAFSFAVNTSGVNYDAMIYNDEIIDSDWNAIWESEVQIDDKGWTIEMEIPFSNLPFYKGKNKTWGLNITRFIQRNYETINWVTFPMDVEGITSQYGHLNGLVGIYPPAKFRFTPNFLGSTTTYSDIKLLKSYGESYEPLDHRLNYINDEKRDLGIDIEYSASPSSRLMLTINPDFGQVEGDPATVNLTGFETYFQEKRPFFLEDSDIFDTPIEIYYSRRIGENDWPLVIVDTIQFVDKIQDSYGNEIETTVTDTTKDYQEISYNVKTAGKWTGKTETGLSYGLLGAITTPQWPEWDSQLSINRSDWDNQKEKSNDKNYFVSRIKQDLFAGNSFIGLMSTSSLEYSAHTYSIDGMTNLFDNQLNFSGQMFMTSDKYQGTYYSMSFSPLGFFNGWIEYLKYDKGLELELNDLGFLWRDDYTQTKLGLQFQSFDPWNIVRNSSIILQGDMEENLDGLNLGKSIELSYDIQFTNFWGFAGGFKKYMEAFNDRGIFTYDDLPDCCPSIFLPEVNEYRIEFLTDQHKSFSSVISLMWQKNSINDTYMSQYIEMTYKPYQYLLFSTAYENQRLFMKHHFLETFPEDAIDIEGDGKMDSVHYVFSNRDGKMDALTFRAIVNYNRKLSLQGYLEIFSNRDHYSKYEEYLPFTNEYDGSTAYILGKDPWVSSTNEPMPIYTTDSDPVALLLSYVDPNNELAFAPKLTSIQFTGIFKWNYMKGSNIYIVYSYNKAVNGHRFDRIAQLRDFIEFNDQIRWVEVLADHTFMIKIDYWFEK